jgi:hypothetical protein
MHNALQFRFNSVAPAPPFCFNPAKEVRVWHNSGSVGAMKMGMRYVFWLLVLPILVLAAPAQARPRDDALTGAFRCVVIADSHQWLDCYYGAAQPVRAALGLSPALAAQQKLVASPPSGGQPRDQDVRDQVVSAAAACMRVTEDRAWLDCYYAAAMPMRAQLGLSTPQTAGTSAPAPAQRLASLPAPPDRPAAPAGPPPMPRTAGLFDGIFVHMKPIVRDMPMESFVVDGKGVFTVTLVDGEVWQQLDEDQVYHPADWHKPASEMRATITPDVMRTFVLVVSDEHRMYKVRRIR